LHVTMFDRGRTMIPSTILLLKLPVCNSNSISMTERSPALSSSTLTPVLTRESLTWCQLVLLWQGWNAVDIFWGGFSSFVWQRGTLQLIAIHLITLPNILEYMQIAIIQTEAAEFVKINICVILKTFGHDCITTRNWMKYLIRVRVVNPKKNMWHNLFLIGLLIII
jgi:hypothetical protein